MPPCALLTGTAGHSNLYILSFNTHTKAFLTVSWAIMVWEFSKLAPGQNVFVHSIEILVPAVFCLPAATNILITTLIVFKIWQAERKIRSAVDYVDRSKYRAAIANTIESCIVYPIVLIFAIVLLEIKNNGQDVVSLLSPFEKCRIFTGSA